MDLLVKWPYLKEHHFRGFDRYRYHAIDTNPLSIYIMHPFWNALVKLFPMWVAPNLMTFAGWLLTLSNYLLLSYYDWGISVSADPVGANTAIPAWAWFYCGIMQFLSYTLDGLDGKQARRTQCSSPLGELFDHGLDTSASWMMPVVCLSVVGIGARGTSAWQYYVLCLCIMVIFYLSHWEKYNTSILFLPWLYDISQVFLVGLYLLTSYFTADNWKGSVLGLPICETAYIVLYVCLFAGALPLSCYNIYKGRRDFPEWCPSILEGFAPLLPIGITLVMFTAWAAISPEQILQREPRIFATAVGWTYAYINCRLIVAQMSGTKCERINKLTVPLVVLISLGLMQYITEVTALYTFLVISIAANVHYGVCVVNALCDHLNVRCFKVPKVPEVVQNGDKLN